MADILIRGVTPDALARIDAEAASLGLSRNEFLRRKLNEGCPDRPAVSLTAEDWRRSAVAFADLDNDSVMDAAWR